MSLFQVQLWPNGKWDGKDYQKVEAESAKEAAEKLYGSALSESGSNFKIRARVRRLGDIKTTGSIFYEP
jgi:hypothetical protein